MRRLFIASLAYMVAGVLSGLFYREFTQLGLAHTHLLTLGFAGIGHILLTAGMVVFFVLLGRAISRSQAEGATTQTVAAEPAASLS